MSFLDVDGTNVGHRFANLYLGGVAGSPPVPPRIPPEIFDVDGVFSVPDGVTLLNITAWGAGGGGGYNQATTREARGMVGAGGACAECDIVVTPGESLTITVGTGGQRSIDGASALGGVPGGGAATGAGDSPNYGFQGGGGGGGYTAILRGSTVLVVAGAGGGGGNAESSSYPVYNDGAGGLNGLNGQSVGGGAGGGGANSSPRSGGIAGSSGGAGGAPTLAATAGADDQGGAGAMNQTFNFASGGGGGGGWAGGGGGGVDTNIGSAGGGGGSGYFDLSVLNVVGTAGLKDVPGNSGDAYNGGRGYGGNGGSGVGFFPVAVASADGVGGRVVVFW